jgi:CubicO group peptidase (beta-lactamase class C family)
MRLVTVLLVALSLAAPLRAQPTSLSVATIAAPEDFREVREIIAGRVASGDAPSIAVAVVRDNQIVWQEAFGWADREREILATPETIYAIGSLSKSVTATGIMVLVDRGVLELDDSVEKYLSPGTITVHEGDGADVTIRRVLHMRGGIPHGWAMYGDTFDPPTIVEYLGSSGIVVFPPGDVEIYSNNAYGVLEAVIAGATGRDFGEFMRSEVFEPLGMHSSFATLTPELVDVAAARYETTGAKLPSAQYHFIPQGGAGGYMSIHDLALYALFHLGSSNSDQSPILTGETLERMHYEKDIDNPESIMALGWGSTSLEDDVRWLVTNGSIGGANSMLTLIPEEGLAVAVLTNISSSSLADATAIMIADAVIPEFGRRATSVIQAYEEANAPIPFEPGPDLEGEWRGRLEDGENSVAIAVTLNENGGASVRFGEDTPVVIERLMLLQESRISASFSGRLPGHPVFGAEHSMELTLRSGGDTLYGHVTSGTDTEVGTLSIPFYVRLEKAK